MQQYAVALILIGALSLLGTGRLRICTMVVGLDFVCNQLFYEITHIADAWYWFTLTDVCAAVLLTTVPCGRIGAVLAATYATQVLMHGDYAICLLLGLHPDPHAYWQRLTAVAYIQLALLFIGGVSDACARLYRLRGHFPLYPAAKDRASLRAKRDRGGEG